MKKIIIILNIILLFACGSKNIEDKKATLPTTDYLLQKNSVNQLVMANRQKISGIKGNFNSFKLYIDKLDNDSLTSIPYALDYVNACISSNNTDGDSIFLLFNVKFFDVVNKLSDSLDTKYKSIIEQLEKDSNTLELQYFKKNLEACGVGIFSTEGIYYLDVIPDFFHNNFKNRVSKSVAEYLIIRKDEYKQGFSDDASMLISFDELYERVKRWENFIKKYPNTIYIDEANYYYTTYTETLITGMDNSRVFDLDENVLKPEVKTLYERIINEGSDSPTTKIIASYYALLARQGFIENDSIQAFLSSNNLTTMLGVQPHTR